MADRMSWDEAKALDGANRKAQRDAERLRLLLLIGEMAVRSNDISHDVCLHCVAEGSDDDPHDWNCPQPLIDRFHTEGFDLPWFTPDNPWRPMEEAPRDRRDVLVRVRPDAPLSEPWRHLQGCCFVGRWIGEADWSLFPGFGGVPDEWLEGWARLPALPELDTEDGEHG